MTGVAWKPRHLAHRIDVQTMDNSVAIVTDLPVWVLFPPELLDSSLFIGMFEVDRMKMSAGLFSLPACRSSRCRRGRLPSGLTPCRSRAHCSNSNRSDLGTQRIDGYRDLLHADNNRFSRDGAQLSQQVHQYGQLR